MAVMAEEPKALITQFREWPSKEWLAEKSRGKALRIISVNCKQQMLPIREALSYDPDIICVQESPGKHDLRDVISQCPGYEMYYDNGLASIIRGEINHIEIEDRTGLDFIQLGVTVGGHQITLFNVHLYPSFRSYKLLNPGVWLRARQTYTDRATQVSLMLAAARSRLLDTPVILAGDFNSPAGDSVLKPLRGDFRDSFKQAGVGLGNTVRPQLRVLRVDYIWISENTEAHAVVTRPAPSSDHCMVIADLTVE